MIDEITTEVEDEELELDSREIIDIADTVVSNNIDKLIAKSRSVGERY